MSLATSAVSSTDPSSTTITSSLSRVWSTREARQSARVAPALNAGTITDTRGALLVSPGGLSSLDMGDPFAQLAFAATPLAVLDGIVVAVRTVRHMSS